MTTTTTTTRMNEQDAVDTMAVVEPGIIDQDFPRRSASPKKLMSQKGRRVRDGDGPLLSPLLLQDDDEENNMMETGPTSSRSRLLLEHPVNDHSYQNANINDANRIDTAEDAETFMDLFSDRPLVLWCAAVPWIGLTLISLVIIFLAGLLDFVLVTKLVGQGIVSILH